MKRICLTDYDDALSIIVLLFMVIVMGIGIGLGLKDYKHDSSPVENMNNTIDSLEVVNQYIQNHIKELDSIKTEQIHEAETLSNDATVELFYKLLYSTK